MPGGEYPRSKHTNATVFGSEVTATRIDERPDRDQSVPDLRCLARVVGCLSPVLSRALCRQ